MLTGSLPFRGKTAAMIVRELDSRALLLRDKPGLPPRVSVLRDCLRDPDEHLHGAVLMIRAPLRRDSLAPG
jgi:hypothetical protein